MHQSHLYTEDVAERPKEVTSDYLCGVVHICGYKKLPMYEITRPSDPNVKKTTIDEVEDAILLKDMSLRTEVWRTYKLGGP